MIVKYKKKVCFCLQTCIGYTTGNKIRYSSKSSPVIYPMFTACYALLDAFRLFLMRKKKSDCWRFRLAFGHSVLSLLRTLAEKLGAAGRMKVVRIYRIWWNFQLKIHSKGTVFWKGHDEHEIKLFPSNIWILKLIFCLNETTKMIIFNSKEVH